MIQGTRSEVAGISWLQEQAWCYKLYDVVMVALKSNPVLAASPDGIAVLYIAELEEQYKDMYTSLEIPGIIASLAVF